MSGVDPNGYITRGEMNAHMRRLDESLNGIGSRLAHVEEQLGAGSRWFSARVNSALDKVLPVALVAVATYLMTH